MAKNYGGKTYNEDWVPIDAMGNALGDKDWAANAAYAAETNTQNPYTNEAGSSPYDKSGLIPGNEPGSTLPKVQVGTRRVSAPPPASYLPYTPRPQSGGGDLNTIQPFPFTSAPAPASMTTRRGSMNTAAPAYVPPQQGPVEDGPRRINTSRTDDLPFLIGEGEAVGGDNALDELAKLLSGILR